MEFHTFWRHVTVVWLWKLVFFRRWSLGMGWEFCGGKENLDVK